MKVSLKANARTIIEVEGETVKDVFEALAGAEEVFALDKCGLCGATGVRHVVRHVDKYAYYEAHCPNGECRARFSFGQSREIKGALFPQRKTKEGAWKPNGGWERWEGNKAQVPQAARQPDDEGEVPY